MPLPRTPKAGDPTTGAGEPSDPATPTKLPTKMSKGDLLGHIQEFERQLGISPFTEDPDKHTKEDLLAKYYVLRERTSSGAGTAAAPLATSEASGDLSAILHAFQQANERATNAANARMDAMMQQMERQRLDAEKQMERQAERTEQRMERQREEADQHRQDLTDLIRALGGNRPTPAPAGGQEDVAPQRRGDQPARPISRKVDIPQLQNPENMNLVAFRDWVNRFEDYAVITNLGDENLEKRRAVLRSALDTEWTKMWTEGTIEVKEPDDTPAIIKALEAYLRRHRHVLLDRLEFHRRSQKDGETVDAYCTALRELDRSCGYNHQCTEAKNHQEERLRDRLVCGLRNSSMRQEVLKTPTDELTLDKVLATCRNVESSSATNSKLSGSQGGSVNVVRQSAYKKAKTSQQQQEAGKRQSAQQPRATTGDSKCGNCGRPPHKSKEDCPAKGKECKGCGKLGHFKFVCRSEANKEPPTENKVRAVFCRVQQEDAASPQAVDKEVTVRIYDKTGKHVLGDLNVLPDTGADACLMSLEDYKRLGCDGEQLHQTMESFTAFNGTSIGVVGWVMLTIHANNTRIKHTFYVTSENRGNILSRSAAAALRIATVTRPNFPKQKPSTKTCMVASIGVAKAANRHMDKEALRAHILEEFTDVFDDELEELPAMKGRPIHIELTDDAKPTQVNGPRPIPLPLRKAAKGLLDDLEQRGVIQQVTEPTEWLHPVTFVPKKPGSDKLRLTVDLRKLNTYVKRPQHPVRSAHDCVSSVPPTARFFSTFDAKMGYHQVELDPQSQLLTTFATPWGRYKHVRATMGLTSAGDEYNCRTDAALATLPNTEKIVDDVLLYDQTWEAHQTHITKFLTRCREHGITLNPKKFLIGEQEVPFAGYVVGINGYKPDPDKIRAIQNFPHPTNLTDLRSFLGLCEQLAGFSKEVTEAFHPLRHLLRPSNEFVWCPEHDRAFEATKHALIRPPVLAYFDATRPTRLETDASRTRGLGYALLQQDQEGHWRLIEARSRAITDTEARYAMVELELLAVRWAMKRARHYLYGLPTFTLVVDHQPLVSILDRQTLDSIDNARIQRLKTDINAYQFKTTWKQGKDHRIADALSRAPVDNPTEDDLDTEQSLFWCGQLARINAISLGSDAEESPNKLADSVLQELQAHAHNDEEYTALLTHLKSPDSQLPDGLRHYKQVYHELSVTDEDLILRHQRLLIPRTYRKEVLRRLHLSHQGIERTLRAARQKVYWPGMTADVKSTVEACQECQRFKPAQTQEPMASDPPATRIFEEMAADHFETGGRHFLAVIDRYSGFPFVAQFNQAPTARTTLLELKKIFVTVGCPVRLYTDGGLPFTARETKEFLQQWGITHRLSTPHYPQSNGLAEAAVKVLKALLKKTGGGINDKFQVGLMELRNTPRGGGKSPAEIVYGRPMRTLVPMHRDSFDKKWLVDQEEHDRRTALKQAQAAEAYDAKARQLPRLDIGSQVRIRDHVTKLWDTYGTIVSRGEHRDYRVRLPSGRTYWRNRRFLRAMPQTNEDGEPETDTVVPDATPPTPMPRRSTRTRRRPNRLQY